jgi:hypothetical protein
MMVETDMRLAEEERLIHETKYTPSLVPAN